MAGKEKIIKSGLLIFIYLLFIIFPLGPLLKINLSISEGKTIPLYFIDVFAGLIMLFVIISGQFKLIKFKKLNYFILLNLIILIFSINNYGFNKVLISGLYFTRLIAFIFLINSVVVVRAVPRFKTSLFIDFLIIVLVMTAVLGWLQYFFYPDLRVMKYLNWDDHLFRLSGTFLDPGYLGLIMAQGVSITVVLYHYKKQIYYLFLSIFFTVTLLFTYSRAAILAAFIGVCSYLFIKNNKRMLPVVLTLILASIIFLPRPSSEGVKLERTQSIVNRMDNYSDTLQIIKKNLLLGTGYNNICWEKNKSGLDQNIDSHSCFGADSSILLMLATVGIIGTILIFGFINDIFKTIESGLIKEIIIFQTVVIVVASFFINGFFYPWIMALYFIFIGLGIAESSQKNIKGNNSE